MLETTRLRGLIACRNLNAEKFLLKVEPFQRDATFVVHISSFFCVSEAYKRRHVTREDVRLHLNQSISDDERHSFFFFRPARIKALMC